MLADVTAGEDRMNLRLYACLLIAMLFVVACGRKPSDDIPFTRDKYRTWEAPTQFERGYGRRNIAFVDDDTVLYLARPEAQNEKPKLTLWSLSTGSIRTIASAVGDICYFRGYLTYTESVDVEKALIREGSIEETTARIQLPKEMLHGGYEFHLFNCRIYRLRDFAPEENCKLPLLSGHGYLEMQGGRCAPEIQRRIAEILRENHGESYRKKSRELDVELLSQPIRYMRASGERVTLPIDTNEIQGSQGSYSYIEWADRYALPQHRIKGDYSGVDGEWRIEEYAIYLLSPDGSVDRIVIPWPKRFFGAPADILVSRAGIAGVLPGFTATRDRPIGVVLARDGRLEQIDDGDVQHWALSPSGCRIAIDSRKNRMNRSEQTISRLRVVDVCSRGR